MPASPTFGAILGDVFYCLGLGLLLAALRDLTGLLLGRGFLRDFLLDVLGFAAAAVAVFGFAAGRSAVGVVRWYMVAGLALGALGWRWSCSAALHRGAALLVAGLALPAEIAQKRLLQPLQARRQRRKGIKNAKKEKNRLQKQGKVIYN